MSKKHDTLFTLPLDLPKVRTVHAQEFAQLLGDLRYDRLAQYLDALAEKLQKDSESDGGRGRGQLAACLTRAAFNIDEARLAIEAAWEICEPYTKD
ncbi:MAG: hypothetical protein JO270_00175 [Acidobacteriaceae bacterium]|nr:hypothetical protein [Acidobacteriaceae bacterium]